MFHDEASAAAAVQLGATTGHGALFKANAAVLMKQARKCAVGGVADVCIFDWFSMFVAYFKQQAEGHDCVEGIWLDEADANNAPGCTFRKLLLGFVLRALRRHKLIVSVEIFSTSYQGMKYAVAAHWLRKRV
jgi:hypothetical protein